jgi:anti-sigma regulatory factor (Ser/Thr protein kinase)
MLTLRHAEPASQSGLRGDCPAGTDLILPAAPESAGEARRFADVTLRPAGVSDTGDFVLVISELAGNAIRQGPRGGRAEILLRLSLTARYVIIQVGDRGATVPPRPARRVPAGAESGRGLPIARALSRRLCWYSDGDWKIVWAAVPRPGAKPRRDTWTRRRLGRAA